MKLSMLPLLDKTLIEKFPYESKHDNRIYVRTYLHCHHGQSKLIDPILVAPSHQNFIGLCAPPCRIEAHGNIRARTWTADSSQCPCFKLIVILPMHHC